MSLNVRQFVLDEATLDINTVEVDLRHCPVTDKTAVRFTFEYGTIASQILNQFEVSSNIVVKFLEPDVSMELTNIQELIFEISDREEDLLEYIEFTGELVF